jgi:hypothetical protein
MTRATNARIAGATFLIYIAAGLTSMAVFGRAAAGEGVASKLSAIAQHPTEMGVVVVLGFLQSFTALILAATLYAVTRAQDSDLAMVGLICRVAEGVIGGVSILRMLALVHLATTASDAAAAQPLGSYLLRGDMAVSATFFAVGSAFFSYLFLRGRLIPAPLSWLGVVASVLLVVALPLQAAGFLRGPITSVIWLPMLAFEVPLAFWLMVKGVAGAARAQAA